MARPRIKFTKEQKKLAQSLAGYGLTLDQIAHSMEVSVPTLTREAKKELASGKSIAVGNVARALYNKATKADNLQAMMFYLKTQAGWKENVELDVHNTDGIVILPAKAKTAEEWVACHGNTADRK